MLSRITALVSLIFCATLAGRAAQGAFLALPGTSGFVAIPGDPVLPDPAGNAFQTVAVYNDLVPFTTTHTHDVRMRFMQVSHPSDPIHPPAFKMSVRDDSTLDNTLGTIRLPGQHAFFGVQTPIDPIFPTDPITPQTLHFDFSALFADLANPGSELGIPIDPIIPIDPVYQLDSAGRILQVEIYHQLNRLAIQRTVFSIQLGAIPSDPIRIANVSAVRGSLDLGFDVIANDPAAVNALSPGTEFFTITMSGNFISVPEPASAGLAAMGLAAMLRRRRFVAR